jgi:hypothetical protein
MRYHKEDTDHTICAKCYKGFHADIKLNNFQIIVNLYR